MSLFEIFKKHPEQKQTPNNSPAGSYINEFTKEEEPSTLSPDECAFSWRLNANDGSVDESIEVDYSNIRFPQNLWIDDFSKVVFPNSLEFFEKDEDL